MFKKLEGDTAILQKGGVYKQADLYLLNGDLFANAFGGFVRLNVNGSTSVPKVSIVQLTTNQPFGPDRFGRLTLTNAVRVLTGDEAQKLLGVIVDG